MPAETIEARHVRSTISKTATPLFIVAVKKVFLYKPFGLRLGKLWCRGANFITGALQTRIGDTFTQIMLAVD